jgi:replicative DNA helicase
MIDRLDGYGYNFQIKIITCLLKDRAFLHQISDVLNPSYFESEATNWVVRTILKYWDDYRNSPTLEVLKVEVEKISIEILKSEVKDKIKDAIKHFDATDLDYVKEQTLDFCKNQTLKKAILDSVDLLKSGEYDKIKYKIDNAIKSGGDRNLGHIYSQEINDRYSEYARSALSTGWYLLDKLMDGGLGKGELGAVMAPAGIGKSWMLVSMAANAVKQGKTVIYYTMELNPYYVGQRFDAWFTGVPFQNLKDDENRDRLNDIIGNIPGELIVKYYPTKTPTVATLSAHIEKCIMQNKKPDLVVVDYADLMRSTSGASDSESESNQIYVELRGLAGEYDIPIWTASQTNRGGLKEDVIGGDNIASSYRKLAHSDFMMSLSRKTEDKLMGTGRIHIIKNRFGADGVTFPSKVNTYNGHIELYEPGSEEAREIQISTTAPEDNAKKSIIDKMRAINV